MFVILKTDDVDIFTKSPEKIKSNFDALEEYCKRWKLVIINSVASSVRAGTAGHAKQTSWANGALVESLSGNRGVTSYLT